VWCARTWPLCSCTVLYIESLRMRSYAICSAHRIPRSRICAPSRCLLPVSFFFISQLWTSFPDSDFASILASCNYLLMAARVLHPGASAFGFGPVLPQHKLASLLFLLFPFLSSRHLGLGAYTALAFFLIRWRSYACNADRSA
jgi:hypothetical protein